MTKNFAAQVRDLAGKVTLLEEEKEKNAADMQKLMRALTDKTTALEEKQQPWKKRKRNGPIGESDLPQLESELALLRSREVDQGAFAELVVEKVLRTIDFGEMAVKMSTAAINVGKQTRSVERVDGRVSPTSVEEEAIRLGPLCNSESKQVAAGSEE